MANSLPFLKRAFDITMIVIAAPLWIPSMILTALAILLTSGWPILYLSRRYVQKNTYRKVVKFRSMVKNAEQLANRDTVTPESDKLLNIEIQDELYTPLGRLLERIHFTELPQLLQVITGTLTLVGNRPMPENMLNLGRQHYPYLDERFDIPSGITGPAQLAGRERLTDTQRLELEITYCQIVRHAYSPLLDIHLLLITLFTPLGFYQKLTQQQVMAILYSHIKENKASTVKTAVEKIIET